MISNRDLGWLAGLLEGEGCFGLSKDNSPNIQLGMTDKDTIEKAHKLLKCTSKIIDTIPKPGSKQAYYINLNGKDAVGWMFIIYSLMSKRRQEKIKEIINQWKNYQPSTSRNNHKKFITVIDGKRFCSLHGLVVGSNSYFMGNKLYCFGCYKKKPPSVAIAN